MAKVTVEFEGGQEVTYDSKKAMLKNIGYSILDQGATPMTLRQLYYQFVGMDLIDNKQSQYQYLGEAIKEARISGKIPWGWIEDRTRSIDAGDHNDGQVVDPDDRFEGNLKWFKNTPDRFHRPRWQGQDNYVEVWVEKEALAGIFATVCEDLKVVSFPNKGYTSVSLLKQAADRIKAEGWQKDRKPYILYFGDFDPSGQDIERNIRDKLQDTFGTMVHVEREALTREQIDDFQLPPQPAKKTDSRYETFVQNHGNMAVELDALPPEELRDLIRESVDEYFDDDYYQNEIIPEQNDEREHIQERIDEVLDE